ncbi:hypothetical protein LCGC14_2586190 [marine sediment metagenome]|uniref:Uncharacterized protein n=1 Tax=marine sediment metagenome TaxID=412755 RepID=A0A0F9D5S2_9ZZZZ
MGDIADNNIESGEDMWFAHKAGNCLQDCIYCEEGYIDSIGTMKKYHEEQPSD